MYHRFINDRLGLESGNDDYPSPNLPARTNLWKKRLFFYYFK